MKKLFMMVALSLIMVACNKDEENELSYWDKVLNEMGETKLSAYDVLQSLRENECWDIVTQYDYIEDQTTGDISERVVFENGMLVKMAGVSPQTYRFNEDICSQYDYITAVNPFYVMRVDYVVEHEDNMNFVLSYKGKDEYRWEIIAYDENRVLVEIHHLNSQIINGKKFLYNKILFAREVDESKWWEKVEQVY